MRPQPELIAPRMSAAALLVILAAQACGSSDDRSPNQSSGGTAGSAGTGGTAATAGTAATGGSATGGTGGASCDSETFNGEATYYDFADGSGNCSFDPTPNDLLVAAMNHTDYAGAAACGACARITGPSGEVTVRIVDRCPECLPGDIDLSPEAFTEIAALSEGRVAISWHYTPCAVSGPIQYRFKEGSNQWWTAIQIRNHRHAIAKLEYDTGSGFLPVPRESYNYFVEPNGMGPGPYRLRVTDVHGHELVDEGIAHAEATVVSGAAQFPECAN